MFSLRCSLFAIDNLLLGVTSLLFTAHLLFGSCFSLVGSSLSSLTPWRLSLAGSMLTTCNWLFPLAAHGLNRSFGCSPLVGGQSPCPRRLFLAVRMLGSHFIKLPDRCD